MLILLVVPPKLPPPVADKPKPRLPPFAFFSTKRKQPPPVPAKPKQLETFSNEGIYSLGSCGEPPSKQRLLTVDIYAMDDKTIDDAGNDLEEEIGRETGSATGGSSNSGPVIKWPIVSHLSGKPLAAIEHLRQSYLQQNVEIIIGNCRLLLLFSLTLVVPKG